MGNNSAKNFIHPFLFGFFPVLFLYSHNRYDTFVSQLFGPLIIILATTIILIISLRFITKSNAKTGIILSLFYILFFSYGSIFNSIRKLDKGTDIDIIIFFVEIIILGIGIFYIVRSKGSFGILTGFLNVFSIALVSFSLFNITLFALSQENDSEHSKSIDQIKIQYNINPEDLPNIYHIILDAYGGEDVLKNYYDYDNSDFLEYLQSKGFFIASKSSANYSKTFLSLGSMFNLNYLDEVYPGITIDSRNKSWWRYPIRDFLFFNFIKKFGYNVFALSSGYDPTELSNADVYKNQGYIKDFDNLLFNTTLIVPVLAHWYRHYDRHSTRRRKILGAFEILKNLPKFSSPTYVFGHIMAPHPPIIFDEFGNRLNDTNSYASKEIYYKEYGGQISYVNSEIKEIIDIILGNPKRPTIIILQGDHGLRSHMYWRDIDKKTNFKESLSILNAFYFHDGNYEQLYESISPVNSFRVILNEYMGTNFKLLDDRSYLSDESTPYGFIEYIELGGKTSLLEKDH